VTGPLPWIAVVASLVLVVVVLVYVALDRVPDWGLLALAGVAEVAALVVTVVACVQLARGGHGLDGAQTVTLVGYLLTGLLILPIGFAWSLVERSRGATAALAVAALTLGFMVLRALQIWNGA
jgi:hypothetical protein